MVRQGHRRFFHRFRIPLILSLILFIVWIFCLPANIFQTPTSTVVTSRDGYLLGARIADDGQWRFPEIDSIPDRFEACIVTYEDNYFYMHPGINPVAMAKAFLSNLNSDNRRGGSTITQQVIRLSRKNPSRTYLEKIKESFLATRLEARYSKEHILKLYVSHAPFGGNVVGLSAASWRYFGVSPEMLSWGEAATLAILPNAPSLIFPGKNEEALRMKRNALLRKLYEKDVFDEMTYDLALLEPLPGKPVSLPDVAPHFTEKIRKEHRGKRFESSIDYKLQTRINSIAENHYNSLRHNLIHNIAVLILDNNTRQVLVYVGNSPTTTEHHNYVDIIDKPRSSGSILKPFLYAAMMGDGRILPTTLLEDIPTSIDGYAPKNSDKEFYGAVSTENALIRSLNVPAVRSVKDYGLNMFYNLLQKLELSHVNKPPEYYGLPIILGGAETSLLDVTNAYAGMASTLLKYVGNSDEYYTAEFNSPVYAKDSVLREGKVVMHRPVLSAGAIYEVLNILKNLNRPLQETNWLTFDSSQPIAWKTGTSFGFKDAWAVGVTPSHAIGVWVGNADGEGRPGLLGIEAAAPILFDVLKELPRSAWFMPPYDDMIQAEICTESGHLAGPYCDETTEKWIPVKGIKSKICPFHEKIFLNDTEQYRVNSSCYPLAQMKVHNWFSLPPVQEYYYRQKHPNYRVKPPLMSDCLEEGEKLMAFIYPRANQAVILPKNFKEEVNEVIFRLAHRGRSATVYWFLDEQFLGQTHTFHEIGVSPQPGSYILTAVDQDGNEVRERIRIKKS